MNNDKIISLLPVVLILYIILLLYFYLKVSKLNKSYLNSYAISTAIIIVIQLMPFLVSIIKNNKLQYYSPHVIGLFINSLFLSSVLEYVGYKIGFLTRAKIKFLSLRINKTGLNLILMGSFFIAIIAFLLLGYKGLGIDVWIFNNRYAYLFGRSGVGLYYILFQLMLIIFFVGALVKNNEYKKQRGLILIPIFLAYFSGSKGFFIGFIVALLFYYDLFIKKLTKTKLIISFVVLIGAISLLLFYQSNINIYEYGGNDYYDNYIMLLSSYADGFMKYFNGKLSFDNNLWFLVPRSIYPSKPFIYGQSTLAALFYGEQAVISGITPSFTPLGMPYADGGLIAIAITFFIKGLANGFIEKIVRVSIKQNGITFIAMFLYFMMFIISPSNFSNVYLFFSCSMLIIYANIFLKRKDIQQIK